jgi:hypothetical protein
VRTVTSSNAVTIRRATFLEYESCEEDGKFVKHAEQ